MEVVDTFFVFGKLNPGARVDAAAKRFRRGADAMA